MNQLSNVGPRTDGLPGPERPLSARSVVASTLLGVSPPQLPVRILVRCGELFGISQGATRTAISRMVTAGELEAEGGAGAYRLAGPLAERHARQAESRRPKRRPWDRKWRQALVRTGARAPGQRSSLRSAMRTLHMAELREGVWLRPDNLDPGRHPKAMAVASAQCDWFEVTPEEDARSLAERLWGLAGWSGQARDLQARLERIRPSLEDGEDSALAPGFLLSAEALRHLVADPLLPDELLAKDWPGAELRRAYDRYDTAYKAAWRDWFQRELSR